MTAYKNTKSTSKKSDGYVRLYQFLDEKKYILGSIVLIGLFIVFMFNSFATLEPVSSITVESTTLDYTKSEEGSWQYTKTAKWISKGKARINIKLETIEKPRAEYTDVILVLDTSGSMVKDKIEQLQKDVNELINDTIPKGNKIALITFNDTATIVNDFTDDTSVLQESINNLSTSGETNYYQALLKVDDILSTYNKESNRDCVVLFLTDGLPTSETPSEVGEYKLLKDKYDYLSINGIQYELGENILDGIKNVTDIQFIASTKTLSEFLYKASISPAGYDDFMLTDYIDTSDFNLKGVSKVSTTFGSASIEDDQVIWNLDGFKTGLDAELTIDINLNDELIGVGGVYPTHTKTDVSYKIESINATESSTKTTILKDNYVVTYEANTPTGCVVSGIPSSKAYSVFDTVRLDDYVPTCRGYQFKEWKIVTDGVEKIGNNQFIMPESNVVIKSIWKKLSVGKSMDGKISKVQTLYDLMADNSRGLDTDIDFSKSPTDSDSGIYTIASTKNDKYPVHYYRGNIENNNIIFANFCWKIVRTTSTGGVKLIYNGNSLKEKHIPLTYDKYISISNDETYPYAYDSTTNKWTSTNKTNSATGTISFSVSESGIYILSYSVSSEALWDEAYFYKDGTQIGVDSGTNSKTISLGELTPSNVIMVKYTKDRSGSKGSDSVTFSVDKPSGEFVKSCNNIGVDSQIGTSKFNSMATSPADVGYMYGNRYEYTMYDTTSTEIYDTENIVSSYYYGDSITYSSETNMYTLTNANQKSWGSNYNKLVGYYTCRSTSTTCSTVYYIAGTSVNFQWALLLSNGETDPTTQTITLGKDVVDNDDGTYSLTDIVTLKKTEWFEKHNTYKNYYVCNDLTSTTCDCKYSVTSTTVRSIEYNKSLNFMYGNDVTWDGEKYTLVDTYTSTNSWSTDKATVAKKYHYTCLNTRGKCTEVYYIIRFDDSSVFWYLTLSSGKNIEDAKSDMFANTNDSEIKKVIDSWYKNNMIDYTEKLEDTIWCNDRILYSGALVGKDTEMSINIRNSNFDVYNRTYKSSSPSVKCSNESRDGFTVSIDSGGNGALTYPIGLLTADEAMLAGGNTDVTSKYYLYTEYEHWLLSPAFFGQQARGFAAAILSTGSNGSFLDTTYADNTGSAIFSSIYGVRPSVSLVPSTKTFEGDGTVDDPYIVK